MLNDTVAKYLQSLGAIIEPCGSRVTCSKVRPDADYDYLVLLPENFLEEKVSLLTVDLSFYDFEVEGGDHYQVQADTFMSFRQRKPHNVNLIVTRNHDFHKRHLAATNLCKHLDLASKNDRVMLFQAVLYGNIWKGE